MSKLKLRFNWEFILQGPSLVQVSPVRVVKVVSSRKDYGSSRWDDTRSGKSSVAIVMDTTRLDLLEEIWSSEEVICMSGGHCAHFISFDWDRSLNFRWLFTFRKQSEHICLSFLSLLSNQVASGQWSVGSGGLKFMYNWSLGWNVSIDPLELTG